MAQKLIMMSVYDVRTSCLFKSVKTGNFRFKPEVRGRISKLMVSSDSACLITLVLTLRLLLICLKPLKPITSGLNRKCVGGSQNGHQNPLLRHLCTLENCLNIHYYSLKPLKPAFSWKTGNFRSLPVISWHRDPTQVLVQPFLHTLQKSLAP